MRGQDVDEFLDETSPEKFDELVAMDRIVPFGDEKICWVLAMGFAALMDRIAAACGDKDAKPIKPSVFIPWARKKQKTKPKYVNPNMAAAAFLMAVNR
jgi:hypothetical protein